MSVTTGSATDSDSVLSSSHASSSSSSSRRSSSASSGSASRSSSSTSSSHSSSHLTTSPSSTASPASSTSPVTPTSSANTWTYSNTAVSFPVVSTRTSTYVATTDSTTTVHSATTETVHYTVKTVTATSIWTLTYTSQGHTSVTVLSSVIVSGSLIPEANGGKQFFAQSHGALAGLIIGCIALLALLGALLIIALRRHRAHKTAEAATAEALANTARRRPANMLADEDEDDAPPGGMAQRGGPASVPGYGRLRGGDASDSVFDRLDGSGAGFDPMSRFSGQSALADLALSSSYYAGAFAAGASADGHERDPADGSDGRPTGMSRSNSGEDDYAQGSSSDHLSATPLLGTATGAVTRSASGSGSGAGIDPAAWLSGRDVAYTAVPMSANASSPTFPHPPGAADPFADPAAQPYSNPAASANPFGDPVSVQPPRSQRQSWDEFAAYSGASDADHGAPAGASGSSSGHGAGSGGYNSGGSAYGHAALGSRPGSSSGHGHDGWSSDGHGKQVDGRSSNGHGDSYAVTASKRSSLLPTIPGVPPTAYRAPDGQGEDSNASAGKRRSFLGVGKPWRRRASVSESSDTRASYVDARSSFPDSDPRLSGASSGVPANRARSATVSPATSQQALNVLGATSSSRLSAVGGVASAPGTFGRTTMRRPQSPTLPPGSIQPPTVVHNAAYSRPAPSAYTSPAYPVVPHGSGTLPPSSYSNNGYPYGHQTPSTHSDAYASSSDLHNGLHPWRGLAGLFGAPDMPSPALTEASSTGAPEGLLDPHRVGTVAGGMGAAGMRSTGEISFRDEVDYSRPIGGLLYNRQHSQTTVHTTSTRHRPFASEEDEEDEDLSYLHGLVS
ncbi:uncharacterized protein C8Q71DRAFT_861938 [Rhodofomes roseus]|uniref:Uncharacterized protein n=1 Tax=Rhodofomes roseus TaxID=34475 RepID=A0ABQ8K3K8_9APHY|nr:uncharacterized protein C8Q71DRAFT_861938 [Rhodofomes roseus]KAH9831204.1 hypothetical protein C8Q71DRAFT_861938 [Rhodofomes roseus]